MNHINKCKQVILEINRILKIPHERGAFEDNLMFISSVLQNQNSNTSGAGLTGGVQQENLFFEMLTDGSEKFRREIEKGPSVKDKDYYYEDYPLSHKNVGYKGGTNKELLALSWSKNPEGATRRTEFESSMILMFTKKPSEKSKRWNGVKQGIYAIPLPVLQKNINLGKNNKSDSIILADDAVKCMKIAENKNLFIPLNYKHNVGIQYEINFWKMRPSKI